LIFLPYIKGLLIGLGYVSVQHAVSIISYIYVVIAKKWYDPGGYIVSLTKRTSGDDVKLELEMSLAPTTVVTWGVDDSLVEGNFKHG
jgi:hypothetical protein